MKRAILWLLVVVAVCGLAAAVKVSELPAASSVGLSDVVPMVVGGQTVKATVGQIGDAIVARPNAYIGSFEGGSVSGDLLMILDGVMPPFHGDALATIGANTVFGLRVHSEQSNGLLASSRNGQAGKFLQEGWDGPTSETPALRVARGIGTEGVNQSPLVELDVVDSGWSTGDAIALKLNGANTFRLTALGVADGQGLVLRDWPQIPPEFVPPVREGATDWVLINLQGVPTFVAANPQGGWIVKPLWQ